MYWIKRKIFGERISHWAAPGILLAILAFLQPWLEASMTRHMGLELPLLFIVGWFAARVAGACLFQALAPWNAAGVPALTFSMIAVSVWMVPSALDYAVLLPGVALAKVISMVLAGMLAGLSWHRTNIIVQTFFIMNWFWMTFVVGMLYREAPQQLCSVYLADEQADAGLAMMGWTVIGLLLWAPGVIRKLRQWDSEESHFESARLL
ncbi:hypothetical protein [Eoetvoesiella caeni]|uniref:Uncharacterized protein n=1 Tax=Eoetvoesiella caeni TaxID=645616 RepID=A0A366H1R0_9BURK|nr:hypothetical protein [Eoetvoesiella caeni]MCI2811088.1 hypothetical protein [Eoetvoesiella caeni]NYT57000.1 hypothetical protein [Eoetvoesiella caeni]RBP35162.1 hypothetical protein DFR37_11924 [Eoetvoesiella caeni]